MPNKTGLRRASCSSCAAAQRTSRTIPWFADRLERGSHGRTCPCSRAILKGILKDSLDYYQDLDRRLRARLKELPRGSILKRRIGRQDYFYLNCRDGRRVVSRYWGRAEPKQIEKEIKERKLIKKQIQEVEESLKMLERLERRKRGGRPISKDS